MSIIKKYKGKYTKSDVVLPSISDFEVKYKSQAGYRPLIRQAFLVMDDEVDLYESCDKLTFEIYYQLKQLADGK